MNYLVAFVAFILFGLSAQIPWKVPAAVASVFFLAVSVVYAARTSLYGWVRDTIIAPVFGWVGGWIGASGTQVASALVLVGAATVVVVLLNARSLTKQVTVGIAVCGFLVALAAGPVAQAVGTATTGIERAGSSTVARWIGA